MSLGALLIAVASFCLSAYGALYARERERLLAQPRFVISNYFDKTGIGWNGANIGLGPARIRGVHLFLAGVAQAPPQMLSQPFRKFFQIATSTPIEFLNLQVGDIIKADQPNKLVWIPSGADADKVFAGREQVLWEICYCSIYDECWLFRSWTGQIAGKRDDSCSPFSKESASIWWDP